MITIGDTLAAFRLPDGGGNLQQWQPGRTTLITLVAFQQIHASRPEIQPFNELLIQYEHGRPPKRRRRRP